MILERSERESRIRRELETHARKLGRAAQRPVVASHSSLLAEVPDLVEYPSVVAGHFPPEFLQLPEEVLTTTMIHHQHYFPVVGEDGSARSRRSSRSPTCSRRSRKSSRATPSAC